LHDNLDTSNLHQPFKNDIFHLLSTFELPNLSPTTTTTPTNLYSSRRLLAEMTS
jgi:hypothetical protein